MGVEAAAGGLNAAISVHSAIEGNRALTRGIRSAADAERRELQQLSNQEAARRAAHIRRSRAIAGRVRAVAGERGTGLTGSDYSILLQNAMDTARGNAISRQNTVNAALAVRSRTNAQVAQLKSQEQNPILAGIMGAINGAQAGHGLRLSLDAAANADAGGNPNLPIFPDFDGGRPIG